MTSMMDHGTIASKRQTLFYQNLIVLGFDTAAMEKEHKIKFDKKMFTLPNQKAFEVVSYFLFSKLNEVSAKKHVIMWPLLEITAHRQFQKTCFYLLSSISQESDIKFPLITPSIFSSSGAPFYELYFAFSSHVVVETNKSFHTPMLKRPKTNVKFHDKAIEMIRLSTISSVQKFKDLVEVTEHHLKEDFKCANNLLAYINKLKLSNATNKTLLDEKVKNFIDLYCKDDDIAERSLQNTVKKSLEYQRKVEEYREKIDTFLLKEEKFWSCISTELGDESSKPVLKGNDYSIPVPDILKDSFLEKYQSDGVRETKGLCILKYLKLFSIALEFYIDSINKGNFSQSSTYNALKDLPQLEKCIEMLKKFSTLLEEQNILDKTRVNELMENIPVKKHLMHEDLPPSPRACSCPHKETTNNLTFFDSSIADVISDENIKDEQIRQEGEDLNINWNFLLQDSNSDSAISLGFKSNHSSTCASKSDALAEFDIFSPLQENMEPVLNSTIESFNDSIPLPAFMTTGRKVNQTIVQPEEDFIPHSWLLEESLNSQSLGEHLSFLD